MRSKGSGSDLLPERISRQRGRQCVQTPQDGVVGLVIFAQIFNQLLADLLGCTKRSRRYNSMIDISTHCWLRIQANKKKKRWSVPLNGRRL